MNGFESYFLAEDVFYPVSQYTCSQLRSKERLLCSFASALTWRRPGMDTGVGGAVQGKKLQLWGQLDEFCNSASASLVEGPPQSKSLNTSEPPFLLCKIN